MATAQSLWMVFAALLFAVMGLCVKEASAHMTLLDMVFFRSLIGCLLLLAFARARAKSLRTSNWRTHWRRGVFGFASLLLFFYAIPRLSLSAATALLLTSPLFLALLLAVLEREWLGAGALAALGLSFFGMLLALRPHAAGELAGGLAALAAGATAGCAYYNIRRLGALGEGGIRTVFYFTLICTALSGAGLAVAGGGAEWSPVFFQWAVAIALTATGGQLALTRALHYGKTVLSSSLMYCSILFAALFDYFLWRHAPDAIGWLGIGLIIGGNIALLRLGRQGAPPADNIRA